MNKFREMLETAPEVYLSCFMCNELEDNLTKCTSCQQLLCKKCSKYMVQISSFVRDCMQCFFRRKSENHRNTEPIVNMREIPRTFVDIPSQFILDKDLNSLIYAPQIDDQLYFIPTAYKNYLHLFYDVVNSQTTKSSLKFLWNQKKDLLCKVIDLKYEFPEITCKKQYKDCQRKDILHILTEITLEEIRDRNGEFADRNRF